MSYSYRYEYLYCRLQAATVRYCTCTSTDLYSTFLQYLYSRYEYRPIQGALRAGHKCFVITVSVAARYSTCTVLYVTEKSGVGVNLKSLS